MAQVTISQAISEKTRRIFAGWHFLSRSGSSPSTWAQPGEGERPTPPPSSWRGELARMAREQASELEQQAKELRRLADELEQ